MSSKPGFKYISFSSVFALAITLVWGAAPTVLPEWDNKKRDFHLLAPPDSTEGDTSKPMKFPIKDRKPYERNSSRHPLDIPEPANVKEKYALDSTENSYNYSSKIGNTDYRMPASVTIEEQLQAENKRLNKEYFRQRAQANNMTSGSGLIPPLKIGPKIFERIFGSGVIDIRPRGTAEITFAGNFNTVKNPAFAPQQQTVGQFDFRQKIQLNVQGSIGDRMKINLNYDTEATFDFENQIKLDYTGKEDDIIKKIELGNVSLPLASSLIQGSQSLFGVKTEMQFGKLKVTSIFTQQRGKTNETEIQGGAQSTKFDIQSDNYDMNRHYFLAHYFRDNYDAWLSNLPIIGSPVIINRIEVWVTNRTGSFENSRDVVGFADLAEASRRDNKSWNVNTNPWDTFPTNISNGLYDYLLGRGNLVTNKDALRASFEVQTQLSRDQNQTQMRPISQYQMISYARLLNPSEYTFNPRLGYISLNQTLNNDDVLCVAYEYTLNGRTYKVGEFTTDVPVNAQEPNVLFTKMLKGPSLRPDLPIWDLMMKNIYSLGAFGVQQKDFRLNIVYADDPSGADLNYIPVQNEPALTGIPLVSVLNLDNLNTQQERAPDGLFDFIEGVTINTQQGKIIFPMVEPFGSYLQRKFVNDPSRARYYCYFELYDSTRFAAIQLPQYNKFFLRGTYQGQSSNEISLNATQVPRGSVKVTANGAPLTENVDYTVDYNIGRVRIINTALLNSGAVIKVSSESNSLFSIQQKTLMGTRMDYQFNRDFLMGGTLLYLNERPLTPKVNLNEEPISNVMMGVDGSWKKDSRLLTKLVDALPFIQTKEVSQVTLSAEYARLFPGVQSSLAQRGTAYLDDFEGSESQIDLRTASNWVLASTPQGQPDLFPEGDLLNDLAYGFKRAHLSWYTIPTNFYLEGNPFRPAQITDEELSNHCVRQIRLREIYPNREVQAGMPNVLPTLDFSFYPKERGPNNYTVTGLNADGTTRDPRSMWGGIMRKIEQNDFEASNIDYIEIWMLDPYLCNPSTNTGQLYINLGNISEDVLRDNRKAAENGLPKANDLSAIMDTTVWGRVTRQPVINYAFDADAASRNLQDVGLDGLDDDGERLHFDTAYLQKLANLYGTSSPAYQQASEDPSKDNFQFYLSGTSPSILERFKFFANTQGNSPVSTASPPPVSTNIPDMEDINRDYTLNDIEEYYQYKIDISKDRLVIGQNYVTDSVGSVVQLENGTSEKVTWYQLKVPIREFEKRVGQIIDFKSIRFIRLFMRGFEDRMVMRFGSLQLVRADWRKYLGSLEQGKENKPGDPDDETQFVVSTVNIEKNSHREPIKYVTPPGIQRELDFSTPQGVPLNEQSLSVLVCNLNDADARGVFKNVTNVDLRRYEKLRMFIHAEGQNLKDGDITAFIRMGTDLTNNYYEYEIPLKVTPFGIADENLIWPTENEMTLDLEEFINSKIERTNKDHPFTSVYTRDLGGGRKIRVVGLPDLSNVRVMMLGVRNPRAVPGSGDDGLPKCAEVWFNEMRATGFNNKGGWAAIGRMQAKLADFGNVQLAGNISTVGFGGIDKKISERSFDDTYQYDVQGSFELGKFFPTKFGLSVPVFMSYGNTLVRPFYNPLNPDTELQKEIDETTNEDRRERISRAADDFTARKSLNFTNVRKNRMGAAKPHVWDVENLSFTYSYSETYRRNQTMEYYILQNYRTVSQYQYSFNSQPWQPFSKLIKSKYLTLIKDFNLYFLPQSWGARLETDRKYGVTINRNNDNVSTIILPLYDKMFTMTRNYEMAYNLSKSLNFNYNATVLARIDEPIGKIDESTPMQRDSMWDNFWKGGRLMQFDQAARMSYNIPINKIEFLNFVSQASYSYQVNYQWKQAPPAADSLGNTISNARTQQWNLNFNMTQLYNKFKFFRDINNPSKTPKKTANDEDDKKKTAKDKKKEKDNSPKSYGTAVTIPVKLITSLKNVTFTYSLNEGTMLPGFKSKPQYIGQNFDDDGPGFDFILAMQDKDYRYKAARNGWLSNDPRITNFYTEDFKENITGRATIEPFTDFRIELNVSKQRTLSTSVLFRYDSIQDEFIDVNVPTQIGTYQITFNTLSSTFTNADDVFKQFQENRLTVANRLAQENGGQSTGVVDSFPRGYSRASQDVLIPAFLAAYSGGEAGKTSLSAFPQIPDLNWRITYNGLSKLELVKEYASNVTINNSYSSTYNVGSFQTILPGDTNASPNLTGDYQPQYQIRQISITERWGPFLGVDVTFKNNIQTKLEYKRDRTLNFMLTNGQLNEQTGSEWVVGAGYKTKDLAIPLLGGNGRRLVLENEINFRFDFSIRNTLTKIRYLDRTSNDPVQGQVIYDLKPQIDYNFSDKLMMRIFYSYRRTDPATSTSFPTIIQSGGVSLRYTIQ